MSDQDIRATVEAAIKTQIVAAFAKGPDLIEQLVAVALKEPMKEGPYSYNTKPYLDHLVGNTIRNAARAAVIEIFAEHAATIKETIRARFSAESVVDSFTSALLEQANQEWRINVKFEAEKER